MSLDAINQYFDNLNQTLDGIPPENIFNHDETNITDDPGAKKVVVQNGYNRVEQKIEHSKQPISLMFCGSATGEYLPPMFVCKAENVYQNWTQGGPTGAVYDATPSGWFDSRTFENWFSTLFVPHLAKLSLSGPKVIVGDKLRSHFSVKEISVKRFNSQEPLSRDAQAFMR